MSHLLSDLSLAVGAAAVVVGAVALAATRDLRAALPLMLDLLLAAGLLRLAASSTWTAIVTAAGLVLIRKVVTWTILRNGAAPLPLHSR